TPRRAGLPSGPFAGSSQVKPLSSRRRAAPVTVVSSVRTVAGPVAPTGRPQMSRSRLSRAWRGPGRAAARWLLQWWVESFVGLGACYPAMPPRPYDGPLPGDDPLAGDDPRLDADVVGWAAR